MESIFWNVRGLMGNEKQLDLKNFLREHKPAFVSLSKTKLNDTWHSLLARKLRMYNSTFITADGRICLFWNSDLVEVSILEHSSQFVHCLLSYKKSHISLLVTSVYASNQFSERLLLWQSILKLSEMVNSTPWLVGGDFNEVRFSSEKVGGSSVHSRRLRKFNTCISNSELRDLKAFGHTLLWNNQQDILGRFNVDWGPPSEATVAVFINEGKWHKPSTCSVDLEPVWTEIQQLEVGSLGDDILIWPSSKTGVLGLSEAWKAVRSRDLFEHKLSILRRIKESIHLRTLYKVIRVPSTLDDAHIRDYAKIVCAYGVKIIPKEQM
ncbi:hypothetical protein QJS04_geneDACA005015 [Acorus gramineus]|uniref:Endonuclease/exonuclease/phosphatase domain-containing protein n=1 Tax=Acorus gramineus TaxID=55184 RepID=A0AAV9B072_ACOGR|nr:hypothetical protein QJS04_geneDACA005015 [Acorus gramineus]